MSNDPRCFRVKLSGLDISSLAVIVAELVEQNENREIQFSLKTILQGTLGYAADKINIERKKRGKEILVKKGDYGRAIGVLHLNCPEVVEHIGKDWSGKTSKTEKKPKTTLTDEDFDRADEL